ncbi:L-aspartate oxidase [Elysia marginata]|uniref:L-aspartate oxidase n=1 Tax=Elysia marginata TaxID=1093978 RepID=A0AAV4F2T6_9GAST|nr:L-aspartate oxidase [Elysia marginata]
MTETDTLFHLKSKGYLDLPVGDEINLKVAINNLKKEKNAVILAHYYQDPNIQDIADYVGDSLGLSQEASETKADIILFAGVHFMAETAKIINPSKKVILPDLNAGCSLAESITGEGLKKFRRQYPNHIVISYINTSADVKVYSDIVCTSSNAVKIVNSIPKEQPIIFTPDKNLGQYIIKQTGRDMLLWDGACIVHEAFSIDKLITLCKKYPEAQIVAHPESEAHILKVAHYIGSTSQMIDYVKSSENNTFIVATEVGILHEMERQVNDKKLIPAPAEKDNSCAWSGIAGLTTAIKSGENSPEKKILIITKDDKIESNTKYAQGGLAAVIHKFDSFEKHIEDTLKSGCYLNKKDIVKAVIKDAPKCLKEIMEWGTDFDTDESGKLHLGKEGGHSDNRIVHHKDISGLEIERSLLKKTESLPNITILQHHFAIDLITHHQTKVIGKKNQCYGAYVLDIKKNAVITISANQTCIATGGIGQVYRHTTNPLVATGDGIAMAYRAKAKVVGMEFIQFHPTALYNLNEDRPFLISEAVRGFGSILRNERGEAFMEKYDSRKDLAPRDIVSRAIDKELKNSDKPYVYLDATHTNIEDFKHLFPNIYAKCMKNGIDISKSYIPVVPAMHYICGGIDVNKKGKTSINNLFACGECAHTGLHGANRLASNSLSEALVFAQNIARAICKSSKSKAVRLPTWNETGITLPSETIIIRQNKEEIQTLMSNYVAIVRSDNRLKNALKRLEIIYKEVESFYKTSKVSLPLGELRNLTTIAYVIVKQSINQRKNIGTFYNTNLE